MKVLAIDTATEACSAALYFEGDIRQQYRIAPREHSHIILPMIDQLLAEAGISVSELDALAFGRGPGSFMGVRIAAGVTQGIAFAWDLPVVPIPRNTRPQSAQSPRSPRLRKQLIPRQAQAACCRPSMRA